MNVRDPTSRLARWNLKLRAYEFEIIHRPGKQQTHVDALSRIVMAITKDETEGAIPMLTRHNIKSNQRAEKELARIIKALEDGKSQPP